MSDTADDYYGDSVKGLAEGLDIAQAKGYVTAEEAKTEFRAFLRTTVAADCRQADAAALRKRADDLEGKS